MQNKIELYRCIYPFNNNCNNSFGSFELAKEYAYKTNKACIIYSPNNIHVGSYMKDKLYMVH